MPAAPSQSINSSLAKKSRVYFSNHRGARARVSSITTTEVIIDSAAELTGTALYTATTPGKLSIIDGAAASDNGLEANITGISGTAVTVDVDYTAAGSAPALAVGDIVEIIPPPAVRLLTNGGHGVQATAANDTTRGHGEVVLTHNTPMTVDVAGPLPFYLSSESLSLARMLAFAFGGYDKSGSGIHDFIPIELDDGTFAASSDGTITSIEGDEVWNQVFYGLFAGGATFSFPQGGLATGSIDVTGSGAGREVGGAGKTYPGDFTDTSNYLRSGIDCDTGERFNFRNVFVEFGGSLGDALTANREAFVTDLTVNINRQSVAPRPHGTPYATLPAETAFEYTATFTKILENDDDIDTFFGGRSDLTGAKTETRMLAHAFNADGTKSLIFDAPNGIVDVAISRNDDHYVINGTFTGIQTLDANNCPDTSNPIVRARLSGVDDVDVLTALE